MKHIFLNTVLLFSILSNVQAQRGRVQIKEGTLVTDKETLLRGARISTDYTDYIPSENDIKGIKKLGLNSIHLYAECPALCDSIGQKVVAIDSIVNMTERDSLYLIITVGACGNEGTFDSAFVNAFWNFYAPRYKDKTHMVFEIMNEPFAWNAPYDKLTILKERRAYDIIRSYAPETHVMFMTYGGAINADSAVMDIHQLGEGIDWTKASIASHCGYQVGEGLKPFMNTIIDSGYAITFTEPGSVGNKYVNLAFTRVFEKEFISYLHFIPISDLVNYPSVFKSPIESSEVRWTPDFGKWPVSLTEINYRNPYQKIEAGFFDEGAGFDMLWLTTTLGYISNKDYVSYYNFNFEDSPDSLIFECSAGNMGATSGSIELILDSLTGISIGLFPISHTENWDDYKTFRFKIVKYFEGIHKIYFVFRGDHPWDLMNLKSFTFKKSDIASNLTLTSHGIQKTRIYPNPAKDFITMQLNEKAIVEIFNMQGKLLLKHQAFPENSIISIEDLSPGSYIIKTSNSRFVFSGMLIIE